MIATISMPKANIALSASYVTITPSPLLFLFRGKSREKSVCRCGVPSGPLSQKNHSISWQKLQDHLHVHSPASFDGDRGYFYSRSSSSRWSLPQSKTPWAIRAARKRKAMTDKVGIAQAGRLPSRSEGSFPSSAPRWGSRIPGLTARPGSEGQWGEMPHGLALGVLAGDSNRAGYSPFTRALCKLRVSFTG